MTADNYFYDNTVSRTISRFIDEPHDTGGVNDMSSRGRVAPPQISKSF